MNPVSLRSQRLLDGRLKTRHLMLAIAIADYGSLSRAAEHLHVTQPVLTRGLKELEDLLGARLFERGPRGMTPTQVGRAFVGHAQAVFGQIRQAGAEVDDLINGRTGTVRVGTHLAGSSLLLPRAIRQLKRVRPGITVVVREATPDVLTAELLSGDLDITVGRLHITGRDPRLTMESLYREPVALVTRPDHPAQRIKSLDLAALVDFPWVVPVEQTDLRLQLESLLAGLGLALPTDRVECTSMMITRYLLLAEDYIAVLPRLVAEHDDQLVALDIALEELRLPVGLTTVHQRWGTPAQAAMLAELRTVGRQIARKSDTITTPEPS